MRGVKSETVRIGSGTAAAAGRALFRFSRHLKSIHAGKPAYYGAMRSFRRGDGRRRYARRRLPAPFITAQAYYDEYARAINVRRRAEQRRRRLPRAAAASDGLRAIDVRLVTDTGRRAAPPPEGREFRRRPIGGATLLPVGESCTRRSVTILIRARGGGGGF